MAFMKASAAFVRTAVLFCAVNSALELFIAAAARQLCPRVLIIGAVIRAQPRSRN